MFYCSLIQHYVIEQYTSSVFVIYNILLQPHVGRFLASDFGFAADFQAMFGHQVAPQRCRLATIVLVWHCLHV